MTDITDCPATFDCKREDARAKLRAGETRTTPIGSEKMEKIIAALEAHPAVDDAESTILDERAHRTNLHYTVDEGAAVFIKACYRVTCVMITAFNEAVVHGWVNDDSPTQVMATFAEPE